MDIHSTLVTATSFLAQALFSVRVIVQLYKSEKDRQISSPTSFWVFSLTGSVMIIIYAVIRKDIVLLLGQAFGSVTYLMNIMIGVRASGSQDSRKGNRT